MSFMLAISLCRTRSRRQVVLNYRSLIFRLNGQSIFLKAPMSTGSLEAARTAVADQVKLDILTAINPNPGDYAQQLERISHTFVCMYISLIVLTSY
jgi:hypothetical protein